MNEKELLKQMTPEERKKLMAELQEEERKEKRELQAAYEELRRVFLAEVKIQLFTLERSVKNYASWLSKECDAFRVIMECYGQIKRDGQASWSISHDDFRLEVKHNKVKRFDERADMASLRLIEYLKRYIISKEEGEEDPLYQLAMTLLERNRRGDLDYKNISKLYSLENKFDDEYRSIMDMFRESNVVETTRTNFYFYRKDKLGVWWRVEPSFNRI